jgi:non-specific serine/threonine protein kinase
MRKLYKIAQFLLDPEARALTYEGAAVALGARGVAVLTALVSRAGAYVQKSAILDAAWPGLVVEEANLAVQISAIRRVLARVPGGEGWIETLARRGYRFVGPVAEVDARSARPAVTDRKRTNLPELSTSFVGRERELAEIKQLLPRTRLLTLTGTGGIGKTRLAQQAGAEVLDAYCDGAWFIDLAPLANPALVPSALAQVLQVKESAGQTLVSKLCGHLRAREILLILDNCEHVLNACARLVEELLRETTQLTVIATSREPIHLTAEHTYPLAPLPLPDRADSIARSDAVQLFVERARQYRPKFDLQDERARAVAQICVRLDGIPLALELAAARLAVLPVEQIVRLLDQRFRLLTSGDRELPRHQTLRAMVDWSYELLDAAEKTLFAQLSVFAGGWTLAAADAVCRGEPIAKDEVVYVLIGLIEQSLVIADEDGDRYRMLETVREYAKEKLVVSGEVEAARLRHRDYFLALAEEADQKLKGEDQAAWLQRLDKDHGNLRSALDWSLLEAGSEAGLRLCKGLWRFWWQRGHFAEGRGWCAELLGKPGAEQRTRARAYALNAAGVLAYFQGDYPAARVRVEESLAIMRDLGYREGIANTLCNLGMVASRQGDSPAARALYEDSLAIYRELGDEWGTAGLLMNLGTVAIEQSDYPVGRALLEETLSIYRKIGDQWYIATSLANLGESIFLQGDYPAARALYEESLAIYRELGNRWCIARVLTNIGEVACEQGDFASAKGMHHESLQIKRELGDRQGIAMSLEHVGAVLAATTSVRVLGAAERLREEIGSPMFPYQRTQYDRRVAAAREAISDDAAFDRAWQEGRALTLEQAIELVLEETAAQPPSASSDS